MIRVLHYIPGFLYGGIESIFLDWYQNIDKKNFMFELLIRTQDDNSSDLVKYKSLGGKYYRLLPISNFYKYKNSVEEFFKNHHDYDILHVHESDPYIMKYAKKYGIRKIVIHSHSSDTNHSWKQSFRLVIEQYDIKNYANYAFACSKKAANWKFHNSIFTKNNIYFAHNAINSEQYKLDKERRNTIRKTLNINNNFIIGHVGRMTYQKNQFYLLDIFNQILRYKSNSVLILIGGGPDFDELKDYSKKLNLSKNILFLGQRDDVADLLQAMDCFLLPSRYEGLPVTLIEAQAAGLPCFISDVITEEADLIPKLIFRNSITEKPLKWAKNIVEYTKNFKRTDTSKQIIDAGYDIKMEIKKLENKYKEIVNE